MFACRAAVNPVRDGTRRAHVRYREGRVGTLAGPPRAAACPAIWATRRRGQSQPSRGTAQEIKLRKQGVRPVYQIKDVQRRCIASVDLQI